MVWKNVLKSELKSNHQSTLAGGKSTVLDRSLLIIQYKLMYFHPEFSQFLKSWVQIKQMNRI